MPRWIWLTSSDGLKTRTQPEHDEQHLRDQVRDGEDDVELGRLAQAADVQRGQQRDHGDAADDVARVVVQRREERARGSAGTKNAEMAIVMM